MVQEEDEDEKDETEDGDEKEGEGGGGGEAGDATTVAVAVAVARVSTLEDKRAGRGLCVVGDISPEVKAEEAEAEAEIEVGAGAGAEAEVEVEEANKAAAERRGGRGKRTRCCSGVSGVAGSGSDIEAEAGVPVEKFTAMVEAGIEAGSVYRCHSMSGTWLSPRPQPEPEPEPEPEPWRGGIDRRDPSLDHQKRAKRKRKKKKKNPERGGQKDRNQ
jgi:hypothetical protein